MGEKTSLWSELELSNGLVKFSTKNMKAKFIAYNFSHFAELHIGSSIRYKYTLVGIIFSNVIKSK